MPSNLGATHFDGARTISGLQLQAAAQHLADAPNGATGSREVRN